MGFTKIKTKDGQVLNFVTQQYEVGLYCIVNNDPCSQFGLTVKEKTFHKKIQKEAKKKGDTIVESSFVFD